MIKYIIFLIIIIVIIVLNLKNLYIVCFILIFLIILNSNLILNLWVNIYSVFSLDFYSFYLIILTIFIIGIILLINLKYLTVILIYILIIILVLRFGTFNLLIFYFIFESRLIPIFLLIVFNGYSFERYEASLYIFFYTIISSIPFLIVLLDLLVNNKTLMYFILEYKEIELWRVLFILIIIVFLVKMPIFFVHIWLLKAHVEAPVFGSIILARVLLKLGRYGILRIGQLFFKNIFYISNYFISFRLIGGVIIRLVCLVQIDIKILVAYSSIVHMRILIARLFTLRKIGFIGSYLIIIGHGLCSSGLFYLVNVIYERLGRRLLYLNKGIININSSLRIWIFLLCIINFSAPIRIRLIGEILMLIRLVSKDLVLIIYLIILSFFRAAYSLYLFSFTQHGNLNLIYNKFKEINLKEFIILFFHWFPLNILTCRLNIFIV